MDKGYIVPEAALKKLRVAKGLGQTVYLWGDRLWEDGAGKAVSVKAQVPLHFLCGGCRRAYGNGTKRRGRKRRGTPERGRGGRPAPTEGRTGEQSRPFPCREPGHLVHPDLPQPHTGVVEAALYKRRFPRHHGG